MALDNQKYELKPITVPILFPEPYQRDILLSRGGEPAPGGYQRGGKVSKKKTSTTKRKKG
jgi:hypothetical protein